MSFFTSIILLLSGTLFANSCMGFPAFMASIPNGNRVPCPDDMLGCTRNGLCEGVGHNTCQGGSLPLNPFGEALRESTYSWEQICTLDSDGDGWTNGLELGDPCCLFGTDSYIEDYASKILLQEAYHSSVKATQETFLQISHPGFSNSVPLKSNATTPLDRFTDGRIEGLCENYLRQRAIALTEQKRNGDTTSKESSPAHREDPFVLGEPQHTFRLQFPNVTIPPKLTSYACTFVDLAEYVSDPTVKYHMVGFKANINSIKYTHHLLLKVCAGGLGSAKHFETKWYDDGCYRAIKDAGTSCYTVFAGWNAGGWSDAPNGMFSFPEEAGQLIIGDGARYICVEAHYTNYNNDVGAFDASSIDFYMTDKLRKYDSYVAMLGPITGEVKTIKWGRRIRPISFDPIAIPPNKYAFELQSDCSVPMDVIIWATRGHGHLYLRSIYFEHIRAAGQSQPNRSGSTDNLGVVETFDYDFQPVRYIEEDGGHLVRQVRYHLELMTHLN